jgi:hypothetical protein
MLRTMSQARRPALVLGRRSGRIVIDDARARSARRVSSLGECRRGQDHVRSLERAPPKRQQSCRPPYPMEGILSPYIAIMRLNQSSKSDARRSAPARRSFSIPAVISTTDIADKKERIRILQTEMMRRFRSSIFTRRELTNDVGVEQPTRHRSIPRIGD